MPQPEHDNPLEVLITRMRWENIRYPLEDLISRMLRENIRYLDWAEFWYSDEPHQGQVALYDRNLRPVQSPLAGELSNPMTGVLWGLVRPLDRARYGHYRLDVVERTVTQLGQARYEVVLTPIPESEQEQEQLTFATIQPLQERDAKEVKPRYAFVPEPIDQAGLDCLFKVLETRGIARVEWVTYWFENSSNLDDYILFDTDGTSLAPDIDTILHNYWGSREGQVRQSIEQAGASDLHTVLDLVSRAFTNPYGQFRLGVADQVVHRIGDAQFTIQIDPWPDGTQPSIQV